MRARPFAFDSGSLRLAGEVVVPGSPALLVVLCHGIPSGRPPDPADAGYAGLARDLAARGHAAAWFTFRGCREAPGDFSPAGWCRDLEGALDALGAAPDLASLPVAVVGSSAGGATAIAVAARRSDVALVATMAAPASWRFAGMVTDFGALLQEFRHAGIVRDPAFPQDLDGWIAEFDQTAPDRVIRDISPRPVLLVQGDADDVVEYAHAERLFEAAGQPKELVRIPGGTHQLRRDTRALDALFDWLERRSAGLRLPTTQRSQDSPTSRR